MNKRRSFFLLEVVIAIILIGMFAYVSLESFYRSLRKQRKMIHALEYSRLVDNLRMDVIKDCWNQAPSQEVLPVFKKAVVFQGKKGAVVLNPNQRFDVSWQMDPAGQCLLLKVKEKRPEEFKKKKDPIYTYFIIKSQDDKRPSA